MEIQREQNVLQREVKTECGARGKMVDNLYYCKAKRGLLMKGNNTELRNG